MNSADNRLLRLVGLLLERGEREAVTGDLMESGEGALRASIDVLGLVLRRNALLWRDWRPWYAALGVALPGSLVLMGLSVALCGAWLRLADPTSHAGPAQGDPAGLQQATHLLLLVGWSWTGGFWMAAAARRTLWASLLASAAPCMFCLGRFRMESLPRLSLLLFLIPAIWGVLAGLGEWRPGPKPTLAMAGLLTVLAILSCTGNGQAWGTPRWWLLDGLMTVPAWLLVGMARRPRSRRAPNGALPHGDASLLR